MARTVYHRCASCTDLLAFGQKKYCGPCEDVKETRKTLRAALLTKRDEKAAQALEAEEAYRARWGPE